SCDCLEWAPYSIEVEWLPCACVIVDSPCDFMLDCLTAVPGPIAPYCRENLGASNVSLTGSLLAQCRRHPPASGPAALCWGTKQIAALWGLRARVAAVRALRFI
ncbi:hypothetical protein TcG_12693, partial [Trypanosoma cruzi]